MVDAIISRVISDLNTFIVDEEGRYLGLTEELRKLSMTFKHIRPMLEDAERRAIIDKSVLEWVLKLKDGAAEVDGIMDEWKTEFLNSIVEERELSAGSSKQVGVPKSLCFIFGGMVVPNKIIKRTKKVRRDLEHIVDETTKYKFYASQNYNTNNQGKQFPLAEESKMFGRNEDKTKMISWLLKSSNRKSADIPVMTIMGEVGLGKTTLAQLVYEDERVRRHFNKFIWVPRSDRFNTKKIMEMIYEAVNPKHDGFGSLENMQLKLADILRRTRNLVVFDDYRIQEISKWQTLKLVLTFGAEGSKIVVITCTNRDAQLTSPSYFYELKGLCPEDSWSMLTYTLRGRSSEDCLELEKIGRKIVEKCQGVPLALKAARGALQFMKTKLDWECFLQSKTWDTPALQTNISPALLLSYYSLSPQLRQCFAYCSILPNLLKIEKDVLVKLWMAQGFLGADGDQDMEQRGREYLDELLGRSFFDVATSTDKSKAINIKMHELFHNLARQVADGECSIIDTRVPNVKVNKARHYLFLGGHNLEKLLASANEAQSLRTLRFSNCYGFTDIAPGMYQYLRFIRVLDLHGSSIKELPSTIGSLKHLRYLDLSRTKVTSMPDSVTDLCSLQTFRLNNCSDLSALPKRIDKMISLRHLEIEGTTALKNLPEGLGRLNSLRTLSKFVISNESGSCKIGDLEKLNLLHGFLSIQYLDSVTSGDVIISRLQDKQFLCNLELCWRSEYFWKVESELQDVLDDLRPHTNLQQLSILNYRGDKFPSWVEDTSFSNLVKIKLCGSNCEQLPALGKLPSLVTLYLKRMNEVRELGDGFSGGKGGFPKLQKLTLWGMHKLTEWKPLVTTEEGDIPTMLSLRKLKIRHCPMLKKLPSHFAETLKELTISNCNELAWRPASPTALERLSLEEPAGTLLKEELSNLRKLRILEILEGCEMKELPKGLWKLRSLEKLVVMNCYKLMSLPEEIQYLTALQQLMIYRCFRLAERCRIGGEDWDKIAFIPNIQIDEKRI